MLALSRAVVIPMSSVSVRAADPNPSRANRPSASEPVASDLTDEQAVQLLRRIGDRDQAAFAALHRSMARRVFAFAMRIVRDEGHAEEVVVDTMLEVWEQCRRFRGGSRVSTWILGIARNKALTLLRRLRPTDALDDVEQERLVAEDGCGFDAVAALQRRDGVRECMCKLSSTHRECMHLVFFEGLSLAEVADIQSCPENTIKTRLFHARKKIEHCLRRLFGLGNDATVTG